RVERFLLDSASFVSCCFELRGQAAPKRRRGDQGLKEMFSDETLGSSALVISPPSTWTHAHDLTEGASDSCLIREACLFRNVG
ncbi:MAG TPA: hypothetical protein VN876_09400, partial [Gemmatimonadaceae bacterium]|nr:hypothetical protein [Gemmatimonadaceae bacterium]